MLAAFPAEGRYEVRSNTYSCLVTPATLGSQTPSHSTAPSATARKCHQRIAPPSDPSVFTNVARGGWNG